MAQDTQDFIDALDTTQPLAQLEQARPTANGQSFRAPGFIGNFDRTLLNQAPPVTAPAPAAPPTPTTPLGTIGTTGNPEGGGNDGGAPSPANGLADRSDLADKLGINNINSNDVINAGIGVLGAVNPLAGLIAKGIQSAVNANSDEPATDLNASTESAQNTSNALGNNDTDPNATSNAAAAAATAASNAEPGSQPGQSNPANTQGQGENAPGLGNGDQGGQGGTAGGGVGGSGSAGAGDGGGGSAGSGGDGEGCFVGDTPILMADGTNKPIAEVQIGDLVLAFEGRGPLEPCRVIGKMVHADRKVINLGSRVIVTGEHPFLTRFGAWEKAEHLGEGDWIVDREGQAWRIPHTAPQDGLFTVYNIEVDRLHTYVAGGFRVHNKYAMGGVIGGRRAIGPVRSASPRFAARRGIVMAEGGVVPRQDETGGGQVSGPGTENSDSVPIAASNGEFVVPAEVVKFYGPHFFNELIEEAVMKTGKPRGSDAQGNPPSPAAQRSFHETQEPDDDDRGGRPEGDADDTQQPEASNPRHAPQGTPLMAAGPTMAPVMAMGGQVDVNRMPDGDLMHHARMSRARGDRAGHQAASQEIARRLRGDDEQALAKGGRVAAYAMGGDVASVGIPGGASPQIGRPQSGGRGPSRAAAAPIPSPAPQIRSGTGASSVHVPPVRAVSAAPSPPAVPISAPGPRPAVMPNPPAVVGQGPATSVTPQPLAPRIANPSASGSPRQPKTGLGMIGRR